MDIKQLYSEIDRLKARLLVYEQAMPEEPEWFSDFPVRGTFCKAEAYDNLARAHAALKVGRDTLAETLRIVSSCNAHYGTGPHCTCSQNERQNIANVALKENAHE